MISFDLGNTLETEKPLQELCRAVIAAGIPVAVISAIGTRRYQPKAIERIKALELNIPAENIHFVFWEKEPGQEHPTEEAMFEAGVKKGRIAKRIGALIHFDDSKPVVAGMQSIGAPAVRIHSSKPRYSWHFLKRSSSQ